jgi:hypothetical protein
MLDLVLWASPLPNLHIARYVARRTRSNKRQYKEYVEGHLLVLAHLKRDPGLQEASTYEHFQYDFGMQTGAQTWRPGQTITTALFLINLPDIKFTVLTMTYSV